MKPSLSLSAAALSLLGTAACGQIEVERREPLTQPAPEEPDPQAHCTAYPSCAEGEDEVAKDTEGARAVSLCTVTIYCAPRLSQCAAYPSCGPDEQEVPEGTDGSHTVSICGATISCAPDQPVQCAAVPACDANETEVPQGTAGAHDVTVCGSTITCLPSEEPLPEPEDCPGCGLG